MFPFPLVDCGPLQSGPNGRVTYLTNTTVVGTVAQYTCISGYTLVGSNQSLCREDGLWSNTDQECERKYYTLCDRINF